jgi:chaperone required for assembly of F1-ATPase
MKDLLDDLATGDGPMQRAQRAMRPGLPKRFYKEARAVERDGAFVLELDGKPARTPARNRLAVRQRALGDMLAQEWNDLGETIDPSRMPLTRLLNVAIDRVAGEGDAVAADIARYAASDLVCYRAGEPAGLVEAQQAAWSPVLDWAREELHVRFTLAEGVRHVEQPVEARAAVRAAVDAIERPLGLAALAIVTALTGSVLIALMLARGALSADAAWDAGHVDEHWNAAQWGEDAEARARLNARRAEFDAAAKVLALTQSAHSRASGNPVLRPRFRGDERM